MAFVLGGYKFRVLFIISFYFPTSKDRYKKLCHVELKFCFVTLVNISNRFFSTIIIGWYCMWASLLRNCSMLFSGIHSKFHVIINDNEKRMKVCVLLVSTPWFHLYHMKTIIFYFFSPCSCCNADIDYSELPDSSYTILFHVINWCSHPLLISGEFEVS